MSGASPFAPELRSASQEATRSDIARAVQTASSSTSTPFGTLVAIAGAESGFRPDARNKHSSAAGPYQITETTWLHLVKTYGAAAGRPDLAALVHQAGDGRLTVAAGDRATVLAARHDVDLSSRLAGKYCDECRAGLAKKLGRTPSEEEVRVAYFLGVGGAARLMNAAAERPGTSVSALLPRAFANHRAMFSTHGRPLNAQQALTLLQSRYARQIEQSGALKSYADANALTAGAADEPATAAAELAAATDGAAPAALTEAPSPPTAEPMTQLAAVDAPKELACKAAPQGGVSCDL